MEWTQPVITVRKILQDKVVECLMMVNLHRVKLLQFAEPKISVTILIRAKQEVMGIIKHSTTLIREKLEMRSKLMEAWRLRDTEDSSSLLHFYSSTNPFKIMNILIWNCKGAIQKNSDGLSGMALSDSHGDHENKAQWSKGCGNH